MQKITSLQLNNFKFFDVQKPIELGGKHLLLYGENGSGKSSIFWALFTLFESSLKKDPTEVSKYFNGNTQSEVSLVNIYADRITDEIEHYDSFIEAKTTDSKTYRVSLKDLDIMDDEAAKLISKSSDFISYKVLYKFQDFWNGQAMDLANIFISNILPFVQFAESEIKQNGNLRSVTNAFEMWELMKEGPGTTTNYKGQTIQVYKYSEENQIFNRFVENFNSNLKKLIAHINVSAPEILKKLGYEINFELEYKEPKFRKADTNFYWEKEMSIEFIITNYLGKEVRINRPQSFLNEAKITAIGLAIRLSVLEWRVDSEDSESLKILVLDDIMISLDMNNRDRLINYLFSAESKYTTKYQILFLTHDKNLFEFIAHKIKQLGNSNDWVLKEMYTGKDHASKKEYPVIIDSELDPIDKAIKYFEAKDYTACAFYLRKELEKIVNERLPPELKHKLDGSYLSLQTLWENMVIRYKELGKPISSLLLNNFKQTKLLVLNPQAHFQSISMPIYKIELENAFKLIDKLVKDYPIPSVKLLLTKGMILQFNHPDLNYIFDCELISEFYIDSLDTAKPIHWPKCRVIKWSYEGVDFKLTDGQIIDKSKITALQKRDDMLDKIVLNLSKDTVLNITKSMFTDHTEIVGSIWTLKEVLTKAGIVL